MTAHCRPSPAIMSVDAALGAACSLPPEGRSNRGDSLRQLLGRSEVLDETAEGVVVRLPVSDELAQQALDLVQAERQCCADFSYALQFASGSDLFSLSVTADAANVGPLKALYRGLAAEAVRDAP